MHFVQSLHLEQAENWSNNFIETVLVKQHENGQDAHRKKTYLSKWWVRILNKKWCRTTTFETTPLKTRIWVYWRNILKNVTQTTTWCAHYSQIFLAKENEKMRWYRARCFISKCQASDKLWFSWLWQDKVRRWACVRTVRSNCFWETPS